MKQLEAKDLGAVSGGVVFAPVLWYIGGALMGASTVGAGYYLASNWYK
jgi:hypothetical protein